MGRVGGGGGRGLAGIKEGKEEEEKGGEGEEEEEGEGEEMSGVGGDNAQGFGGDAAHELRPGGGSRCGAGRWIWIGSRHVERGGWVGGW